MPLRWLQARSRSRIVPDVAARRAGMSAESIALRRVTPEDLELGRYVHLKVDDYWLERVMDDGQWLAAFRFTVQDGRPVVSELRVFPAEGDREMAPDFLLSEVGRRGPGQWSAEHRGHLAMPPRGGLNARLVHGLKIGEILRQAHADLQELRRTAPTMFGEHMEFAPFSVAAARRAMTERRPGRKGHGLLFFAQLAEEYVDRMRANDPRPAATIAQRREVSPLRVRDMILRARQRGLLTPAPAQGQRGGELTPKASAILAVARREHARTAKALSKRGKQAGSRTRARRKRR